MDEPSQIDELLTATYSKALSILNRIEEISQKRFPSDNPRKLLDVVKGICKELRDIVPELREEYKETPDAASREVKFLARFLAYIASDLRYIDSATTEETPWSLIRPIEKFAETVLPHNIFIFRPKWRYNYGILSGLIGTYKRILEKEIEKSRVSQIFEGTKDNFYVISFPGLERGNILLHASFGHEIGHPIAKKYHEQEIKKGIYILEVFQKIEESIGEELELIDRFRRIFELTNKVLRIRQRGLEETVCDLVGARLFGPSSLFAAEEVAHISCAFDNVKPPDYYPPWRYRIREILADLEERGMNKILANISNKPSSDLDGRILEATRRKMDRIKGIVSQKRDLDEINKNRLTSIAYDSIKQTLPDVKKFLDKTLSGHTYDIEARFSRAILPLCRRLHEKIPPNTIEEKDPFSPEPVDFRDIINAGWFYKLTELSSMFRFDDHKEYQREYDTINRLTLKAIELSEVSLKYSGWKRKQSERIGKK